MSSITNPASLGLPSNPWLSGILWGGSRWQTNGAFAPTYIYYASATGSNATSAAETQAYKQIFSDISKICNVTFLQGTTAYADIVLSSVTSSQMQTISGDATNLGVADPPGTSYSNSLGDYQSTVYLNRSAYSPNGLNKGGYSYAIWLHEIGHAMGLAHPHDTGGGSTIFSGVTASFDSYGLGDLNQGIFTTMSYNDGWDQYFAPYMPTQYGWQGTMMAFDVAALQYLYGANMSTATGNDTYALSDVAGIGSSYQCIWDAGGWDQIYYGGSYGCMIDLRAATLDPYGSYGAGGFISYVYTPLAYSAFTIANGVTIDQAYTGSGNDTLIGNEAVNVLFSNGGSDSVFGLGGDDLIWAGDGSDAIYGGTGNDALYGVAGSDRFIGDAGGDQFNLYYDVKAGDFDYIADFAYMADYVILPAAYRGSVYFYVYNGAAYGYVTLGGGAYVFGAAGLGATELQGSTYYI
jgi:serralysin